MTEAEWLSADNLQAQVHHLGERFSFRKARLFAVACGQSIGTLADNPSVRGLLRFLERVADNPHQVKRHELYKSFRLVSDLFPSGLLPTEQLPAEAKDWAFRAFPDRMMNGAALVCAQIEGWLAANAGKAGLDRAVDPAFRIAVEETALRKYAALLHDIVGNPFQPVVWQPAWQTSDVVGIARGIYEEPAFDRLPFLADALMDAGCDADAILDHCRLVGPHVRGCWVVDLALGKN